MAQIDSSIYFQQQAPDILGGVERGMNMRHMMDQRKKAQELDEKNQAISDAYQSGITKNADGSVGFDSQKTLSQMGGIKGAGKDFLEAKSQFVAQDASQSKALMEKQLQQVSVSGQILGGVKDQASWLDGLQKAQQMGLDISKLPQAYDQGYVDQLRYRTMSGKEQLENQIKQTELGYKGEEVGINKSKLGIEGEKLSLDRAKLANEIKNTSRKSGYTEGQKSLDKDYAKDYNDWTSTGRTSLDKNLQRLQDAKRMLESDGSLTGSIRGMLPDVIRNSTNESAIRVRDQVRAAAQGALKATLGSAFTEKEGERIMNQAYNERLSPAENIRKIDEAILELQTNKNNNESKAKHFQRNGSLVGLGEGSGGPELPAVQAKQQGQDMIQMTDGKGGKFSVPKGQYGEAIASGLRKDG